MLKKLLAAGALAFGLAGLLAHSAAEARTLDEIIKSGAIRVGVNPTLPPLGKFDDKNEIVGFDVDFATEIAKTLGVKLEVVQTGSPDRIPFVVANKIDFVMGAMTRDPERAKVIDFTRRCTPGARRADHKGQALHRLEADSTIRPSPSCRCAARRRSSSSRTISRTPRSRCSTIIPTPCARGARPRHRHDRRHRLHGRALAKHKVEWKIVETPIDVYYCGLGVSKASTGLKDWLNVAIFEMHRRGKTDDIWKKWFGMDMIKTVGASPYF